MSQTIRVFKRRLQISQKKWNTVQNHSLRIINNILNTFSKLNLIQRSDIFSKTLLAKFPEIPDRLAFHLTELINISINDLKNFLTQFSDILKEMRNIEKQFCMDFSLMAKKHVTSKQNTYSHDLEVIEQAERTIQKIVDMYETELALRKQLLSEIQESVTFQPLMITTYLVLWSSEVYIEPTRIHELIEEFAHVEKIYQSQRHSQDSYNSVPKTR